MEGVTIVDAKKRLMFSRNCHLDFGWRWMRYTIENNKLRTDLARVSYILSTLRTKTAVRRTKKTIPFRSRTSMNFLASFLTLERVCACVPAIYYVGPLQWVSTRSSHMSFYDIKHFHKWKTLSQLWHKPWSVSQSHRNQTFLYINI